MFCCNPPILAGIGLMHPGVSMSCSAFLFHVSGGRLVAADTLSALRRQANLPVAITVTATPEKRAEVAAAFAAPQGLGPIHLTCAQEEKLQLLSRITALATAIADIEIMPPSLEDIYAHFSRRAGQ